MVNVVCWIGGESDDLMVNASKILTVSYGTFSCTLEGFDDPFSAMRSIAEYFRDLAADDRYFGAEPPQPDAEMLHQIAEREIKRRVEARIQENGVHLRQIDDAAAPAPVAPKPAPSPVPTAAHTARATQEHPAPAPQSDADVAETVAEKLKRIRAAVARAQNEPQLGSVFAEDESPAAQSAPDMAEEAEDPEPAIAEDTAAEAEQAADEPVAEAEQAADEPVAEAEQPAEETAAEIEEIAEQSDAGEESVIEALAGAEQELPDAETEEADVAEAETDVEVAEVEAEAHTFEEVTDFSEDSASDESETTEETVDASDDEAEDEPAEEQGFDAGAFAAVLAGQAAVNAIREDEDEARHETDDTDENEQDDLASRIASLTLPEDASTEAEEDDAPEEAPDLAAFGRDSLVGGTDEADTETDTADNIFPIAGAERAGPEQENDAALTDDETAVVEEDLPEVAEAAEPEPAEADEVASEEAETTGEPLVLETSEDEQPEEEPVLETDGETESATIEPGEDEVLDLSSLLDADDDTPGDAEEETAASDDVVQQDTAEEPQEEEETAAKLPPLSLMPSARVDDESDGGTDTPAGPTVRVVKMSREEFDAARSAAEAAGATNREEIRAVLGETGLSAEDEAELIDELVEAQTDDTAPAPAATDRAAIAADLATAAAEVERRSGKKGSDPSVPVSRLLAQADTEFRANENSRRRSAIAHLKAAVAAVRADGGKSEAVKDAETERAMDQYRDDLASAVRKELPAAPEEDLEFSQAEFADDGEPEAVVAETPAAPAEQSRPRRKRWMAPLMLVSEQRVDKPDPDPAARLVRPRRIRSEDLDLKEQKDESKSPAMAEKHVEIQDEEAAFQQFVEDTAPEGLQDMLEASAAFASVIVGESSNTRPQIMARVAGSMPDGGFSREEGLRAFGVLLREGRIVRVERGRFTVAPSSRFNRAELRTATG
ncbi:hypothetical protein [Pseudoruegeria sp. HB172150]|uniref:hypothetical protein n=1 Tax=Pseudoruegeria sp. HB172150 TaxID=2721164 RepID=UPI0015517F54|nr:hypothetical protein [Pseudoruegeria sp. HB172150]